MLVPVKLALLMTLSDAPAALVIAPAEVNTRLPAVLVPASWVDEASLIDTALPTKVRLPKLTGAPLPSVIFPLPALKLALPLMLRAPVLAIGNVSVSAKLPAVKVPSAGIVFALVRSTAPVVLPFTVPVLLPPPPASLPPPDISPPPLAT